MFILRFHQGSNQIIDSFLIGLRLTIVLISNIMSFKYLGFTKILNLPIKIDKNKEKL